MLTSITCATCKDNKCEIRQKCPDDETSKEPRIQEITIWPKLESVGEAQ